MENNTQPQGISVTRDLPNGGGSYQAPSTIIKDPNVNPADYQSVSPNSGVTTRLPANAPKLPVVEDPTAGGTNIPTSSDLAYTANAISKAYQGKSAADLYQLREQLKGERSDILGGLLGNYADTRTKGVPFTLDQDLAARKSAASGYDSRLGDIDQYIQHEEEMARIKAAGSGSSTPTGPYKPGDNPIVDSYVDMYNNGTALADIIKLVPGVKNQSLRDQISLAIQSTKYDNVGTEDKLSSINDISSLLNSEDLSSITGKLDQYRGPLLLGDKARTDRAIFNNLKGKLQLEAAKLLKGQGQISDNERRILEQASTKLDRNLGDEEFRKLLIETRGVLQTHSGLETNVTVTDPKTGQIKTGPADRNMINQAIKKGYRVDYTE